MVHPSAPAGMKGAGEQTAPVVRGWKRGAKHSQHTGTGFASPPPLQMQLEAETSAGSSPHKSGETGSGPRGPHPTLTTHGQLCSCLQGDFVQGNSSVGWRKERFWEDWGEQITPEEMG